MQLRQLKIVNLPPFESLDVPFTAEDGTPRSVTVLLGGGGVGKTTILHAIASTRPGHAVALPSPSDGAPRFVVSDWILSHDDPERPHPLTVATPNVRLDADDTREAFRRREQALFDRAARKRGYAYLALSSTRWFSKQPFALSAPGRTIARYDVRAVGSLDDASRADLARETKQALAYAAITAALREGEAEPSDTADLGDAMADAVNTVVGLAGFSYVGLDPRSFEPMFESVDGRVRPFDALPRRARHLVAFAALPTRTLWGAYPGDDPREREAVVAIDEVDLHQDAAIQSQLVSRLRAALPGVQWILTTTSPVLAGSCDAGEVLALRRLPEATSVELFAGPSALVH